MHAFKSNHYIRLLAAGLLLSSSLQAQSLVWDSSGTSPATPVDGPGTWDTTGTNWSNGVTDVAWNNALNTTAVFGNGNGAAGTVSLGTGITAGGLTFNAPGSGSYTISGGTLTLAGATPLLTANVDAAISSVIAGSNGFTKTGAGTLTLSGSNTYGGSTILQQGVLAFTTASAIGTGPIVFDGGTLRFAADGNAYTTFNRSSMVLTTNGGTLDNSGTNLAYMGVITTFSYQGSGARTFTLGGTNTRTSSLQAVLGDGTGGATTLVKDGASSWSLNRANTYTGDTFVNAGELFIGTSNAISTASTVRVAAAGTVSFSGSLAQTIANLQDGTGGGGVIQNRYGGLGELTVQSGSFSGTIRDLNTNHDRAVVLNKTTSGTLRLSGNNNAYSAGTNVTGGTLLVNNTSGSALGLGSVSVTNATLGGNGFIALQNFSVLAGPTQTPTFIVGSGGVIAPGDPLVNGGIGTLTLNGGGVTNAILQMDAGSSFAFTLGPADASDMLRFYNYAGASDFLRDSDGVVLNFFSAQEGEFDLFSFYSDAGSTLTDAGFDELTSFFELGSGLDGFIATWDYDTTGIISLQLSAVPEPATSALVLGGLLLLALRRERRQA